MFTIVVDARGYEALVQIAERTLVADVAIARAERIVGLTRNSPAIFVVRCDDVEAWSLLAAAERDSPAAARDIRQAMSVMRSAGRHTG
jgi:hypothetical protein